MPAVCKTAILKAESFNLFMNTLYFNLKKANPSMQQYSCKTGNTCMLKLLVNGGRVHECTLNFLFRKMLLKKCSLHRSAKKMLII